MSIHNPEYLVEAAEFVYLAHLLRPFNLALRNAAAVSADDVRVVVRSPALEGLVVLGASEFPDAPDDTILAKPPTFGYRESPDLQVDRSAEEWTVEAEFGRLVPGASRVTRCGFYLGATFTGLVDAEATVYAHDTLPIVVPLTFDVTAHPRPMTFDDLRLSSHD